MELNITQNQYCRFGGLKRFLIESGIDVSNPEEIKNLQLSKTGFSDSASFLCDEELKELKKQNSFWTEFDYEAKETGTEFNFQIPVEKYNPTFYSHYGVIRSWFSKSEEIKKNLLKPKQSQIARNKSLFSDRIEIENLHYFELVRKICGAGDCILTEKNDHLTVFLLYKISSQLQHPAMILTSSKAAELHIPFYGFYAYFNSEELPLLNGFISYISQNFQTLLSEIEKNHNSYMEEKYGEEFLKLKKHEMQFELKKQLEQKFIRNFQKIIYDISSEFNCESQTFENKIQFTVHGKKQRFTFNFSFEELQVLLKDSDNCLKAELKKCLL